MSLFRKLQTSLLSLVLICFCADLSKNKLTELPVEVTRFTSLEKLNLYHNVIRSIPDAVVYLQCLTYLDIR